MLKRIFPTTCAFDCEWVPDPVTLRRNYSSEPAESDASIIARAWQEAGATEESPQPFLKVLLCRIVSICGVVRKVTETNVELKLICLPRLSEASEWTEEKILRSFLTATGQNQAQLVGYNCLGADLPAVVQRALVHGISVPDFGRRPEKPWEGPDYFSPFGDHVFDIGKAISFGRQMPTLHQAATACSIPGKLDLSGDQVFNLWSEGRYDDIIRYNVYDALTTYLLWLRCVFFAGLLDRVGYIMEQRRVVSLIEAEISQGHSYLRRYLDAWKPSLSAV